MRSSAGSWSSWPAEPCAEMGASTCRPLSSGHRVSSFASSSVLSRMFCCVYRAKSGRSGGLLSVAARCETNILDDIVDD